MSARRASVLGRVGTLLHARNTAAASDATEPVVRDDLNDRVAQLEAMVEGLQDALYRHAQQTDERLAELQRRMQPENVAKDLSDDARRRGL